MCLLVQECPPGLISRSDEYKLWFSDYYLSSVCLLVQECLLPGQIINKLHFPIICLSRSSQYRDCFTLSKHVRCIAAVPLSVCLSVPQTWLMFKIVCLLVQDAKYVIAIGLNP